MNADPIAIARKSYRAYVDKDRAAIESLIADDFHFTSPLDNRLDRKPISRAAGRTAKRSPGSSTSTWSPTASACS